MKTIIKKVDKSNPQNNLDVIKEASEILNNGGLVAFPTETVYGLGADALNPKAVKSIYEAKGRPSDNPLIVHISDISEVNNLVKYVSEKAEKLMNTFWPGPLTIIFNKKDIVPKETSGGLDTVAIRFPENKIANYLIKFSKIPIAAPSANSSGKPSPTNANHVMVDLNGKIDMILDGGSCKYGLESTIIDVTEDTPCLLRPGSITKEMIENIIGKINIDKSILSKIEPNQRPKAPGMKYKHYSPEAEVMIINGSLKNIVNTINKFTNQNKEKNIKTAVIASEQTKDKYNNDIVLVIGDRLNPETIASNLFKILRQCDELCVNKVYVESFDENEIGMAIMNRLKKSAGYNILNV